MAATVRAKFPGTTTVGSSATSPVTQSVTVVAGDVLQAHVTVNTASDTGISVSATANGVTSDGSVGPLHSNGQTAGFEQVFYWLNPAAGTYNVVATSAGGAIDGIGVKVYAVAGSDHNAPGSATFAPSGTGNNTAASVTSPSIPTGGLGIASFCAGSAWSSTGQTTELNATIPGSSAANSVAGSSAAGAGSAIAFTATISAGDWYAAIVLTWGAGVTPLDPNQAAHWLYRPPGLQAPSTALTGAKQASETPEPLPAPPYFKDWATGTTPDLIVSAEDWGLMANAGLNHAGDFAATYEDYFTSRQAQGYNAVEVSLFGYPTLSGGANGADSDGTFPFTPNTDPSGTPNSTFWTRRDTFFTKAAAHGIRVFLNVSTPNVHNTPTSFTLGWTNTQWSNFGTFIGTRYASTLNIMWELGDDYFDDIDSGFNAFLTALRAAGAGQPISIQNYQEASSRRDIFNNGIRPWGSTNAQYNMGYSYNFWYDVVEKMGLELDPLPFFASDGFFLASGATGLTDVQLMRRMIWWALSSGSKGFQVGDNDIWTWSSSALAQVTAKTFYTTVIPAIAGYFRSLPGWHLLIADTSNLLVTSGRGTHGAAIQSGGSGTPYTTDNDAYVTASRTPDGSLAVIYMSHASTIGINETKLLPGYQAYWVDPKTATATLTTSGPTYSSSGLGNNSDGQADWVLVLRQPATGPTLQSFTAGLSFTSNQTRTVRTGLSGVLSFTSSQTRAIRKGVSAALSFTSSQTRSIRKGVGAALSFTSSQARVIRTNLAAALSFTGSVATGAAHLFTQALNASLSFTSSQTRSVRTNLAAGLSFTGSQTRAVRKTISAALSFTSSQARVIRTNLAGALSFTGAVTKRTAKNLGTAVLSFTGSLSSAAVHHFTQSFSASLSFTGSVTTAAVHFFTQALNASLSFTSSQTRSIGTHLSGGLSFTGSLPRRTAHGLSAGLSFTSSQARVVRTNLAGALSFTGAVTKRTAKNLGTATLSFTGSLATLAVHFFTQALNATLSFTGSLSTHRTVFRVFSASLSFTSSQTKRTATTLVAGLSFTGSITKRIAKTISAALGLTGLLASLSSAQPRSGTASAAQMSVPESTPPSSTTAPTSEAGNSSGPTSSAP